jgi:sugar lactone lactonase YvrE
MNRLKHAILLSALTLACASGFGQSNVVYVWRNLAGEPGGSGNADGPGAVARFNAPDGVATDAAANVYVADYTNNTIRKISSAGRVTTLAGIPGQSGANDGPGVGALFNGPSGLRVDNAGNIYVADFGNDTIRKVTSAGVVSTLAGSAGFAGASNGVGTNALFNGPVAVALDAATNIYVADYGNNTIRKVTSTGVVTTLAGSAGQAGTNNGTGTNALFYYPCDVAVDAATNLYVPDLGNETIRKITSAGVVTTLAGVPGVSGTNNGADAVALFNTPISVALDSATNLYVADYDNNMIRKVSAAGMVTTLAGSVPQPGSADGAGTLAQFNNPSSVAVDAAANVYVADEHNHTIRLVTPAGVVSTLAGTVGQSGFKNGTGTNTLFYYPTGVAVDAATNVYVADSENNTIRKITPAGLVTTFAGSPGNSGTNDGPCTNALFYVPVGVAVDRLGNLYVADEFNYTIRKVTSNGVVTTIGGTPGVIGGADGIGAAAAFAGPTGVAVDGSGRVYVADFENNRISIGTPPPTVGVRLAGANLVVSWPSPFPEFALQQNASPANPGGWQTLSYGTNDDGTNRSVTFPSPSGKLFFRLIGT